ncbi:MAG: hypothetical protein C0513_05100 [Isosphaera sp.]|nr:hypothetical protein [Isosphaera sp.]
MIAASAPWLASVGVHAALLVGAVALWRASLPGPAAVGDLLATAGPSERRGTVTPLALLRSTEPARPLAQPQPAAVQSPSTLTFARPTPPPPIPPAPTPAPTPVAPSPAPLAPPAPSTPQRPAPPTQPAPPDRQADPSDPQQRPAAPAGPAAGQGAGSGSGARLHDPDAPNDQPEAQRRAVSFAGLVAGEGERPPESVVYVVDASGPMVTTLREVFAELTRSIESLDAGQRFSVVLFQGEPAPSGDGEHRSVVLTFSPQPVPATRGSKDRAAAWLAAVRPVGPSRPLDGIRAALTMRPEVVFVLSRAIQRTGGPTPAVGQALRELDGLNPRSDLSGKRPVSIKTVQFVDPDPVGLMRAIAAEHGQGGAARLESNHRVLTPRR